MFEVSWDFLGEYGPSPLERQSKVYDSADSVDTTALGKYFKNDLGFIAAHQRMQDEFRIQAADWQRKRDLEKKATKTTTRMERREVGERAQYEMGPSDNKRRRTEDHYRQDHYSWDYDSRDRYPQDHQSSDYRSRDQYLKYYGARDFHPQEYQSRR
ncbi:hypothetical protein BDZ45DRAFT_695061 [Acephala macrosclerotiorum]|nr:hypothetical protein BDZ45DRAFT_695061 [Acephala macrosclerotiorum]